MAAQTDMLNTTVVTISIDLLAPVRAERFLTLFEVASRKSLRRWRLSPGVQADVLAMDLEHSKARGVAEARCLLCVGEQVNLSVDRTAWVSWLPEQFTVVDLIGALDRAAIFLHEQRNRVSRAEAAVASPEEGGSSVYRITSWVVLPAPFDTPSSLRAMAVLSKGGVSLDQLCRHSQMEPALAQQLLQKLARRGLLVVQQPAGHTIEAGRARPRAPQGLLQRFSRWVQMGGRA